MFVIHKTKQETERDKKKHNQVRKKSKQCEKDIGMRTRKNLTHAARKEQQLTCKKNRSYLEGEGVRQNVNEKMLVSGSRLGKMSSDGTAHDKVLIIR